MSHVYLIGFMGAGKSSVGRRVSRRISRPFVDLDALIESQSGRTVNQLFAEQGEDGFRRLETSALESLVDSDPSVVACGGGVILRSENQALLSETGYVVYLKVSAKQVLARVGHSESRPLLLGDSVEATVAQLLESRENIYETTCDVVVETDGRSIGEVAEHVVDIIAREVA